MPADQTPDDAKKQQGEDNITQAEMPLHGIATHIACDD